MVRGETFSIVVETYMKESPEERQELAAEMKAAGGDQVDVPDGNVLAEKSFKAE